MSPRHAYSLNNCTSFLLLITSAVLALPCTDFAQPRPGMLDPSLNADVSIDPDFSSALFPLDIGSDSGVHSIAFPSDGKVVVGGAFFTDPGPGRPTGWVGLARLNAEGSLDPGFMPLRLAWWAEQF